MIFIFIVIKIAIKLINMHPLYNNSYIFHTYIYLYVQSEVKYNLSHLKNDYKIQILKNNLTLYLPLNEFGFFEK
jgi:hypothetical protein